MDLLFPLSEYFTSFQGEGPFTGKRCLFIRFSTCNFSCPFCDSRDRLGVTKHNLMLSEILNLLLADNHNHLVITGGEPLLYLDLLNDLRLALPEHIQVEVETNGSIEIPWYLAEASDWHFNISPKVCFSMLYDKSGLAHASRSVYKFPLNEENYFDTLEFISIHCIENEDVWVMPMSESLEEYMGNKDFVTEKALLHGWNFSTRLQIMHRFA